MANPNDEKAALGRAIGCRNAAAGIMFLIFGFKGHRRLAGLSLFVWVTLVGPEDIYICIEEGTSWRTHAVNWGLVWRYRCYLGVGT